MSVNMAQRPNGSYRVRWQDRATGRWKSRDFTERSEAKRFWKERTAAEITKDPTDPARGRQRFLDFAVNDYAMAQEWTGTTPESFQYAIARVEGVLSAGIRLDQIDELVIKRTRQELQKRFADTTVRTTMAHFTAVLRSAHRTRRIAIDPTLNARAPRRQHAHGVQPQDVPTRSEALSILEHTPERFRFGSHLAANGCRVGEVLGFTESQLDLRTGSVVIDRQLLRVGNRMVFGPPKRGKVRSFRLSDAALWEARRHLRDFPTLGSDGLLFTGARGQERMRRDAWYDSSWKPALVGAGLPHDRFVFHSMRHFCASAMIAEGVPEPAVAHHIGDTVETLRRVYVHFLRDDEGVPVEALNNVFRDRSAISRPFGRFEAASDE